MKRWAMVIDLTKCNGCYTCVMACKMRNGTPKGVFWNRVLEREEGEFPNVTRTFLPVLCNHCKEPPCVEVCPTGASFQRADGIVNIEADKCIGCRYCTMACPYEARVFVDKIEPYYPAGLTPFEEVKYANFQEGTVTKCNFCVERVDQGLDPFCVAMCPTAARTFGDLNDPESAVSLLVGRKQGKPLLPEAGTGPCVFYIK